MLLKRVFKFTNKLKASDFIRESDPKIRAWYEDDYKSVTVWAKDKHIASKFNKIALKYKGVGKEAWSECDKKG